MIMALCAIGWLLCGLAAAAYWHYTHKRDFPSLDWGFHDNLICVGLFVFGTVGLVAILLAVAIE